jgi:hypothetical protein
LEEEVMNNDSLIWKEKIEPKREPATDVAPSSPETTNDTRSVLSLEETSLFFSGATKRELLTRGGNAFFFLGNWIRVQNFLQKITINRDKIVVCAWQS